MNQQSNALHYQSLDRNILEDDSKVMLTLTQQSPQASSDRLTSLHCA